MHRRLTAILFGISLFTSFSASSFGQAVFTTSATPVSAADIGEAELTGGIQLSVNSGTSVAANFVIQYSATITNNRASEILVVGTGGLNTIASTPTLDRNQNAVIISVPSGGTKESGSTIRMIGVRVALAGGGYTSVTATVTGAGSPTNTILAGQSIITVINSIRQPFSVTVGAPVTWAKGVINSASDFTTVRVVENYIGAFSSFIGFYGQTQPSQLRLTPFPPLPAGVTVTFPIAAGSPEDGANFQTVSGVEETVPRKDGSTDVVYKYTSAPFSSLNIESFTFSITVAVASPATSGRVTFQATLLPLTSTDPESPSTTIPRYTERLVPDETQLGFGSSQLAFPFQKQSAGIYTGIAITNPVDYRVNVTLTAYDTTGVVISGSGITNPRIVTLPSLGQYAKLATEVFGTNFNASNAGTIRATAATTLMPGFYLEGSTLGLGLDGTTAEMSPKLKWVWPVIFHTGAAPFNIFQMFNPGTTPATATLKLYDSNGVLIKTATQTLPAVTDTAPGGGTIIGDLRDIFTGLDLNSIAGGYVNGSSDVALVTSENFGNALDSNVLQGQSVIQQKTFDIAHFASGGGYTTELNIVNQDSTVSANVTFTLYDNSGTQLANPLNVNVPKGGQLLTTIDQLFPTLGSALTTGYIQLDIEPSFVGPFGSTATVAGSIRFSAADGSSSAALPLFIPGVTDYYYSQVAQNQGYYTGIAILNPSTTTKADVNLDVYSKDGELIGTYETLISPGRKISRLLYEMIPDSNGQVGGYVHITSDQPVISFSLFGTSDGKLLSAIPPQSVTQ